MNEIENTINQRTTLVVGRLEHSGMRTRESEGEGCFLRLYVITKNVITKM